MDVKTFANEWHLKVRSDECGEAIVPGRVGQIYEHRSGKFGCMVLAESSRVWSAARRKLAAAGCQIFQNGDTEGTALFDPEDAIQGRLAISAVRAKRKRILSEAQKVDLVGRLHKPSQVVATADTCFISSEAA